LIQESVLEAEQNRARKDVLQVLALRFGEEQANEFREALGRITALERLEELHELAVQARRLSQFRKATAPG
jgi:hypothetical protein